MSLPTRAGASVQPPVEHHNARLAAGKRGSSGPLASNLATPHPDDTQLQAPTACACSQALTCKRALVDRHFRAPRYPHTARHRRASMLS